MPISPAATPGIYASSSELIALVLLTFKLEGYPDLRVVNNSVDITSRGQVFEAVGFKIQLVNQDSERLPSVTLQIDNLDPRIIEYIRALPEAPRMRMEVVTSADNFQSPEQSIDFLRLVSVNYNALVITGQLVLDNYLGARFPGGDYTPSEFPALFGIAGAGSYGFAVPEQGPYLLFDAPMRASTSYEDISPYRRWVRPYGDAKIVSGSTGGELKVGVSGARKDYLLAYAVYIPSTSFVVEFDFILRNHDSIPVDGFVTIFQSSYHAPVGQRPMAITIRKSADSALYVRASFGKAETGIVFLEAPFNANHRTTLNLSFKHPANDPGFDSNMVDVTTFTVDLKKALTPDGADHVMISGNTPLTCKPVAMAWGYDHGTTEWLGGISNARVTSSDDAIIQRQLMADPDKKQVSLLLKCNDVDGGTRLTDSGYFNLGDLVIDNLRPGISIARSEPSRFDGYAQATLDATITQPSIATSLRNLNFGLWENDFCFEILYAPHRFNSTTSNGAHNSLLMRLMGNSLTEGLPDGTDPTSNRVGIGFQTVGGASQLGSVSGIPLAPVDFAAPTVMWYHSPFQYIDNPGGGQPVRWHNYQSNSEQYPLTEFGGHFVHLCLMRQGMEIAFAIDGQVVDRRDCTDAGIASRFVFGAIGIHTFQLAARMDCYRLTIKDSVYKLADFIPPNVEFPDATHLPPGTEGNP